MRTSIALLLVPLIASPSCEVLNEVLAGLKKPTARVAGVHIEDLDLESLALVFDLEVDNPYGVALPVLGLAYDVRSRDREILGGDVGPQDSIPAGGSGRISLPARLEFADVLSLLSDVRPGQVLPYEADLDLKLNIPGGESLSIPLATSGRIPIPAVPDVQVLGLEFDTRSLNQVTATLNLSILNTNEFGLDLERLRYGLSLGEYRVVEAGVEREVSFSPGGSASLSLPVSFRPIDLGLGLYNVLTGSEAGYSLDGILDANTEFGPISLPYSSSGRTTLFQ